MQAEAGVTDQPALHCRSFVGGGVVDDDMHVELVGDLAVDQVQETLELSGPVAGGEVGDDLARGRVEGGVEVGGPVAAVVMRAPLGCTGEQWQDR